MRNLYIVAAALSALAGCASVPAPPTGAQTFATHCASCHGRLGEGDGPMVDVMRVNVPNLRQLTERNNGRFPADTVASYIDGRNLPASHGDRVMPVWGDVFDTTASLLNDAEAVEARIEAIISYLDSIQYDSR